MTRTDSTLRTEIQSVLPLDVLADPDDVDGTTGRVWTRADDVVTDRELHDGARVVAGWGDRAWRTTLHVLSRAQTASPNEISAVPEWTLDPPKPHQTPTIDYRLRDWHLQARTAMAELLPNAIDAATRSELVDRILAPPKAYVLAQESALHRLAAAHRTLRWSARRVVLATVAASHLGIDLSPATSPAWLFLARLSRIPRARVAGEPSSRGIYRHDFQPQCPTARSLQKRTDDW